MQYFGGKSKIAQYVAKYINSTHTHTHTHTHTM